MSPTHPDLNSAPAQEERNLLGISREDQARSFARPQIASFAPGDNVLLATLIHGESSGQPDDVKIMVGSTAINRLNSGRIEEFGANLNDVIFSQRSPYFAASQDSPQFRQARTQNFPDTVSENDFKKSLQIANGLIRGTIPRHEGMFFFEGKEISALKRKKKKDFDFKKVRDTGRVRKFHTFSY